MGFRGLGLGFGHLEWEKKCQNGNGISLLTVTRMGFEHWEMGFGKNAGWD